MATSPTGIRVNGTEVSGAGPHVSVLESLQSGMRVAVLSAIDADAGDTFTFELLNDAGGRFFVSGGDLRVTPGAILDATESSYTVTVRVTDSAGNVLDRDITVGLTDDTFHEVVPGTAGSDELFGLTSGTEYLVPGGGDDTVRSVNDIVVFSGPRADYQIEITTSGDDGYGGYGGYGGGPVETQVQVTDLRAGGPDGTDLVIDPAALRFADGDYSVSELTADIPTGITLDGRHLVVDAYLKEDVAVGTAIGTLGGRHLNPGETFTFSLVDVQARGPSTTPFLDTVDHFELVGGQIVVAQPIDFEQYFEFFVRLNVFDESGNGSFDIVTIQIDDANEPPSFGNFGGLASVSEHADISAGLEIGTIFTNDDALGSFDLFLTGDDAELLEIVVDPSFGPQLALKPGAALDFESNPTLDVTIHADDPTIAGASEASLDVSIPVLLAPIVGTNGDDSLPGTPFADFQIGLGGNDVMVAVGNDHLRGGGGNDTMVAGAGTVKLVGGAGDDIYSLLGSSTSAETTIEGTTGTDTIDALQAASALVLDLATGQGSIGQQQIVLQHPADPGLIEIVFSQDLSNTFTDDLPVTRSLIADIVAALQSFDPGARFAATSFIDKESAGGVFLYNTDAPLTADPAAIQAAYDAYTTHGNITTPEGQLEALLQIAVRTSEIGWSGGSTRIVVQITDEVFHQAGDRDAPANNGDAVLDPDEDYPSIAQVAAALETANIIPIFAITEVAASAYEALVYQLGRGSVVDLAIDSSNIVQAISEALGGLFSDETIENVIGTRFADTVAGNDGANTLSGRAGKDLLQGGGADDKLKGGGGDDTLEGGEGDDILNGGAGLDLMRGGQGDDVYDVDEAGDEVIELAGEGGGDKVRTNLDSYSLAALDHVEDLRGWSATGQSLTGNSQGNGLLGFEGNDALFGLAGDDRLKGGLGDDRLEGGAGRDILLGGGGSDSFVLGDLSESPVGAARDIIVDFVSTAMSQSGHDTIDLSAIDAILGNGNLDDLFVFRGTGAFQDAGDLRYNFVGNNTMVTGDVDGDHVGDFEIRLRGQITLNESDFLL